MIRITTRAKKKKDTEEITATSYLEGAKQCRERSSISGSTKGKALKRTVSSPLTRMSLKLIVQAQSSTGERSRELSEA